MKIYTILYIGILLFCYNSGIAQPYFNWAKSTGLSNPDVGRGIGVDNHQNVYLTGYFHNASDLDPSTNNFNISSNGDFDIFITKLDRAGNFLWGKGIGGDSEDISQRVVVEPSGGYLYILGYFQDTVDFDPGPNTHYLWTVSQDAFILKLDSAGNFVWVKQFACEDGWSLAKPAAIALDANHDLYFTGGFMGTIDFDPSPIDSLKLTASAFIAYNSFVCKLDSAGNLIWAKSFKSTYSNFANNLVLQSNGTVYLTGQFYNNTDFDTDTNTTFILTPKGRYDAYIAKLDIAGDLLWAKSVGAANDDIGWAICLDNNNDVYIAGIFNDSVDFDPGIDSFYLESNGGQDVFFLKLDAMGDFQWAKSFGNTRNETPLDMVCNHLNQIYLAGEFGDLLSIDTVDFNPDTAVYSFITKGSNDIFISQFDIGGNFVWAGQAGGNGIDEPTNMISTPTGNLYLTGGHSGINTDFNPETTANYIIRSNGNFDVFALRLGPDCSTTNTVSINSCYSYTVPSGRATYFSDGVYLDTISNTEGCDSVLTINLNLQNTSSNMVINTCSTYTVPSGQATYTTSGIYTDTIPNTIGCDSIIIIHLTILNNTNILAITVCDSFTVPSGNATYTNSGIYRDTLINMVGCDSILVIHLTVQGQAPGFSIYRFSCGPYTSPSGNHIWNSSAIYKDTLHNILGCDSITYTINLTVTNIDTSVTVNGSVLTSNASTGYRQWLDCNDNYAPIWGATQASFTPTTNGSYAVRISKSNCEDTSSCYLIGTISTVLLENETIKAFPNPVNEELFLEFSQWQEELDIKITNALGQVINNTHHNSTQFITLKIEGEVGVYFVEISNPKYPKPIVFRILKQI